jgi:hypothetical protein
MTNTRLITAAPAVGQENPAALEALDLTPDGLADAPAHELDLHSLVHTGNS